MMNMFIYYYFLNRKEGQPPVEATMNAIRWSKWWSRFDKNGNSTTPSPYMKSK